MLSFPRTKYATPVGVGFNKMDWLCLVNLISELRQHLVGKTINDITFVVSLPTPLSALGTTNTYQVRVVLLALSFMACVFEFA